jgi:hypothetical protein
VASQRAENDALRGQLHAEAQAGAAEEERLAQLRRGEQAGFDAALRQAREACQAEQVRLCRDWRLRIQGGQDTGSLYKQAPGSTQPCGRHARPARRSR